MQGYLSSILERPKVHDTLGILGIVVCIYLFLLSIGLIGASFKLLGTGFAHQIIGVTSNPFVGLFIGILSTSLVQSSSATTSMVVGMVAGGVLTVENAIPIVMGSNIGTSVTNTLVSIGHIGRRQELRRSFAASTVHDFFNLLAVAILFPLQYFTNFLGLLADAMGRAFEATGGLTFSSPVKVITEPVSELVVDLAHNQAVVVLVIGLTLLFLSLKYLVTLLRSVLLERLEVLFDRHIFKTTLRGFFSGLLLTVLVQSSSITTSIVVPLAGAGILTLRQIYPYTLGVNIGTTFTAILASLVSGTLAPVTVAFSHLLFNICGIALVTPIPFLRNLPLRMAEFIAAQAARRRWVPLVYIVTVFFLIPLTLILLAR